MKIQFIHRTSSGDFRIGYKKPLKTPKLVRLHNGDKEKTLLHDEVVILSIPKEEMNTWCLKHKIKVEVTNRGIRYYERA